MSTDTTPPDAGTPEPKLSPVEGIKETSRYLRGVLADELEADTDHFTDVAKNLLKFHGSYQQEDRDARKKRDKPGVGKAYMMMIRLRMPGGLLTADQYLALDDLAEQYANGTLRFTTRQSIQYHGVVKSNLKATIAGINHTLLSTLSACGDVNRNVMACPAPLPGSVRQEMQALCTAVADHLTPKAGKQTYHEIWLNGEPQVFPESPEEAEPIYGKTYLPRKFKTAFSLPDDNCTDIYAQCLGFLAIVENGKTLGYNLLAGGGMGQSHGNAKTFPHLAKEVCFVEPHQVVRAAEGIIKLFRDHGNRSDRKRARLKYVMNDWGVEKFREVFARDYFGPLVAPKHAPITGVDLHLGWHRQHDGNWFLGVSVENGRVKDEGSFRLRAGLREIVKQVRCTVRVTAQQDVLLCDIPVSLKPKVDSLLNEYGIPRPESLSMVQRWSMACPAIPTCPLAISESERMLPALIDNLEGEITRLGLGEQAISIRMTGCPNGCARPYNSDIGIVGRSGEKYTVFVGGRIEADRLSFVLQDLMPKDQIVPAVSRILARYQVERTANEGFGDYCTRLGQAAIREIAGIPTK
jgi:sulfite reductase (ferredoxin)